MHSLLHSLEHGLTITLFVFIIMVIVDFVGFISKGQLFKYFKTGKTMQYFTASFLGSIPGCLGSFMNISLYKNGLISLGALTGGMIATSGDAAFVLISIMPGTAFILIPALFVTGIAFSFVLDKVSPTLRFKTTKCCEHLVEHHHTLPDPSKWTLKDNLFHPSLQRFLFLTLIIVFLILFSTGTLNHGDWDWMHITIIVLLSILFLIVTSVPDDFIEEHIWEHNAKTHVWKIFLWTTGALFLSELLAASYDVGALVQSHIILAMFIAAILGIIPEAGPGIALVVLFGKNHIPLSVLVTHLIVQDGHGMLPLLSYSIRDFLKIKGLNIVAGLLIGFILFFADL